MDLGSFRRNRKLQAAQHTSSRSALCLPLLIIFLQYRYSKGLTEIDSINITHIIMYRPAILAAVPALLAISVYYIIAHPFFCKGMCCMVKSACADVPMTKHLVQPKYEKVASALAESLSIGWDLGASVFVVSSIIWIVVHHNAM